MEFNERLLAALRGDRAQPLFDYAGKTYALGEISDFADRTIALLDAAHVPLDAKVGVVVRNRVLHAAAMLGLISRGRRLTTIYAIQSPEAIGAEIVQSRFAAVIADADDWTQPVKEGVQASGAAGIILTHDADSIGLIPQLSRAGSGPFAVLEGEPGLEILSSGTTGKPKRIVFPFRMLVRAVESVTAGRDHGAEIDHDILTWPYGGIGGMCNLVAGVVLGRHTTILDKFNVPQWVEAVRRYRPSIASGPPAVARMVLDAGVSPEDIASIRYFYGGGAPMSAALQTEFEGRYGIKVIWAYGATEFCGTIISWTPALHEEYKAMKAGAMGRALPGISLRVADVESGVALPAGETGYLQALVPAVGDTWINTTDLVTIDEDGFIFHRGRGDGAILRGGFKVLPEKIVGALQNHPAILDAAVIGLPDARLGEVPVAAVQLRTGAERPTETELRDFAKRELVVHHVPVRFLIVDALPRTTSLKVDLGAVRRLFEEEKELG